MTRLLGFILLASFSVSQAVYIVDTELETYQNAVETRLNGKFKGLFGEESSLNATVVVHLASGKAAKSKNRNPSSNKSVDLGYLPSPLLEDLRPLGDGHERRIEWVDVTLYAMGEVDPDLLNTAREVTRSSLASLNPKIRVVRRAFKKPEPKVPAEKGSEPASREVKSEKPNEDNSWTHQLLPIGLVVAALILCAGMLAFGFFFRSSMEKFAAVLDRMVGPKVEVANAAAPPRAAPVPAETKPEESSLPEMDREQVVSKRDRYLLTVKQAIEAQHSGVARAINEGDVSPSFIRELMLYLDSDQQTALWSKMRQDVIDGFLSTESPPLEDGLFLTQLARFTERVVFYRLQGATAAESALGMGAVANLNQVPPENFVQWAKKGQTPALFRLAGEFLPVSALNRLFEEAAGEEAILNSVQVLAKSLDANLKELAKWASELSPRSESTSARLSKSRTYYLERRVTPTLVRLIESKDFGFQDRATELLRQSSPEVADRVSRAVWNAEMVLRIPPAQLSNALKALQQGQRAALLVALPQSVSARVEALMPEGNIRTIAKERALQTLSRNDKDEMAQCLAETRQIFRQWSERWKDLAPISDEATGNPSEPRRVA